MNVFVTGANGFLGAAVVAAVRDRGHDVTALVRSASSATALWLKDPRISVVQGDLRAPDAWSARLAGADCVVHLAAAKAGGFHEQFASTVVGTERLLAAMTSAGIRRLVHISSFSVYDYLEPERNAVLDESSTLEQHPLDRDEYAQVKLLQEQLVRAFPGDVTIIRPGLIYGPGAWWNAGRAMRVAGRYWLTIAPNAAMKLTHVRNCADAIAMAVEQPAAIGATFNIVDDDLPSQRQYERMLRDAGLDHDRSIPVPFAVASFGANLLLRINRRLFGGRAKLPGIAVPAKQAARFKPLRYQHDAATRVLGWKPQISLIDAVAADEKAAHGE